MNTPSPANLPAALDELLDPFCTFDADWRYTYANTHAAALAGRPAADLIGRVLWDVFPEAGQGRLHDEYLHVMREREARQFELHLPSLGLWEEARIFPFADGVAAHFRDITTRKTSELRRRQLLDLTRALTVAGSETDVMNAALDVALPALGAYAGLLLRPSDDHAALDLVRAAGYDDRVRGWTRVPLDVSLPITDAARAGIPVYVTAEELDTQYPAVREHRAHQTRALAALPLVANDTRLGVLALSFDHPRIFTPEERDFAGALAAQLAQALERARLLDAERAARQRSDRLQRVTAALAQTDTPAEVVNALLAHALHAVSAYAGSLVRVDPGRGQLVLLGQRGYDERFTARWQRFPLDLPLPVTATARDGQARFLTRADITRDYPDFPALSGRSPGALALLPLAVRAEPFGVLVLSFQDEHPFTPDEQAFLLTLADLAATALERTRLAQAEREHAQQQAFLAHAGELLASSLDLEGTLASITTLAVPHVGDWCGVYLPDGEFLRAVAVSHVDPAKTELLRDYLSAVPLRLDAPGGGPEVFRTGAPLVLPTISDAMIDALGRDEEQAEVIRTLGLRSYLGVPMVAHGRTVGVLAFAVAESDRSFGPEDVTFALDLARRAALALDHARLFQEAQSWGEALEGKVEDRTRELATRNRTLEAFAHLTRDLATETDRMALLRRAQEVLLSLLPDGVAGYFELDGDRWRARVLTGELPDPGFVSALHQGLERGRTRSFDSAFDTGTPQFIDVFEPNAQHVPEEALARLRSVAALPIGGGDTPPGVLVVALYQQHGWTPADRVMLETALGQVRLALSRADAVRTIARRTAELEELNQELEGYSYTISHDLRAPARHITTFAALLRRALGDDLPERASRPLGMIETSATRMTVLIEALLGFAQTSRRPLTVTDVDMGTLVEGAIDDLHLDVTGQEVRWDVDLARLPVVRGDAVLLRQVLVNLLGNAVKYSATRAEPTVRVTCEETPDEVVLHITDNGVGFDPRFADRLFGVFQRLHRADEFEGTGIGLATVRRIVGRHGGRVWAESRLGEGATFSVALPVGSTT
ncbi:GAF domain-containing protein [Deinococcus pimensis]|uniref:GAF domain-containing protein n=1 Tax=Deinococcus pimensis TaxID=309888 RepID=UPI0004BB794D|nr:GAF domain-containing protein [Deinococcus pimensis]